MKKNKILAITLFLVLLFTFVIDKINASYENSNDVVQENIINVKSKNKALIASTYV